MFSMLGYCLVNLTWVYLVFYIAVMIRLRRLFTYRFKVVSDGLVDESDDPSLETGVSQLIEHRQLEHQQRFLQTESHRTKAKSLYSEQDELKKSMTDRLNLVIQPKDSRIRIIRYANINTIKYAKC